MAKLSKAFDNLTHTFSADCEFFDALMEQASGEAFLEMCVWYLWLREYLKDIQNSLHDAGQIHGPTYQVLVVAMTAGIAHSIGMLMYLVSRGVTYEAAASGRRGLEYLGVASHLIRDPGKVRFVEAGDESPEFEKAFIRGQDQQEHKKLKAAGIRYRFAGMSTGLAKSATQLYKLFSRFNVHGGTMSSLTGVAILPAANSCLFHNRSLDEVSKNLQLFKPVVEIAAMELMDLVGRYGARTQRVNEAGACVLVWSDHTDPRWLERLDAVRRDIGLTTWVH